jgi:hypothetical protein
VLFEVNVPVKKKEFGDPKIIGLCLGLEKGTGILFYELINTKFWNLINVIITFTGKSCLSTQY